VYTRLIWRSGWIIVNTVPNLIVPSKEGTTISFLRSTLVHGVCHVVCAYILKVQFVAQNVQDSGYADFPSKYRMYLNCATLPTPNALPNCRNDELKVGGGGV